MSFLLFYTLTAFAADEPLPLPRPQPNPCEVSRYFFGTRYVTECESAAKFASAGPDELHKAKEKLSSRIAESSKNTLADVNADSGAQCALASVYQGAISEQQIFFHRLEVTIKGTQDQEIKLLGLDRGDSKGSFAIGELNRFSDRADRFAPCLECKKTAGASCAEPCSASASFEVYFRRLLGGVYLDQTLAGKGHDVADRAKQEIRDVAARLKVFRKEMEDDVQETKAQADELKSRRVAIHQKYRCSTDAISAPDLDKSAVAGASTISVAAASSDASLPNTTSKPKDVSPAVGPGAVAAALAAERSGTAAYSVDPALDQKLRSTTMLITNENSEESSHGTGFFVRTTDASGEEHFQFLTAEHVPKLGAADVATVSALEAPLAGGTSDTASMRAYQGQDASWSTQFEKKPGDFDLSNDAVKSGAPSGPALDVAREGDLPQAGDRYVMAGYPAGTDSAFSENSCTFQGYAPGHSAQQYLFDCPGAVDSHGMSGGPIVRASDGKVFGLLSIGPDNNNQRLVGVPVYQQSDGTVVFGTQPQTIQQNCYYKGLVGEVPHTCSILPPGYE